MLQPRRPSALVLIAFLILADCITGQQENVAAPRIRRQDANDVTTVLLVDNHGRSSLGRYLNVKPAVGLLTSTARTFIQEGVTTEYATQVLGTTLDNGRLYAHLLTKSSRVLYDNDLPTKSYDTNKKWLVDNDLLSKNINFIKNTDFISPNQPEPYVVFPTNLVQNFAEPVTQRSNSEEELLNSASSDNARIPYQTTDEPVKEKISKSFSVSKGNNVKVFQVNPQQRDINLENYKEQLIDNDIPGRRKAKNVDGIEPSKVRGEQFLPTFTVRNEFAPSGYSFLGDLPDFDTTERSKVTTVAERKAKLLFRGGLPVKQELKDLHTVTYKGFADFTTIVGDTVIIFTPHTSEIPKAGQVTSISGAATLEPTNVFGSDVTTTVKTFLSHDPGMQTKTITGHKFDMKTALPTMVIEASNRREPKNRSKYDEQREDMDAKSSVLAHEQDVNQYNNMKTPELDSTFTSKSEGSTTIFGPDVIQSSETQSTLMLSTPSDEDIAKIVASLSAAQAKQATEPLPSATVTVSEEPQSSILSSEDDSETKVLGGATTIFFDDDPFAAIQNTATLDELTTSVISEKTTTTNVPLTSNEDTTTENVLTTQQLTETTEKQQTTLTTEKQQTTTEKDLTTNEIIMTSEEAISTIGMQETTPETLPNEVDTERNELARDVQVACTDGSQVVPTTVYKTLTYLTTFFIPLEESTSTSIKSREVISTEVSFQTQPCTDTISSTATVDITTQQVSVTTEEQTTPKQEETITPSSEEKTTVTEPEVKATTQKSEEKLTTLQETTHDLTTPELEGTTELLSTADSTTHGVETTPPLEITTERRHVTESDNIETTEAVTDSGEEIELIFKTLYTTYTYLTTYFQESTSSIASRKVVITNVLTSTLDPAAEATDPAFAGLIGREANFQSKRPSFDDFPDINPTSVGIGRPTDTYSLSGNEVNAPNKADVSGSTPALSPDKINTDNAIKTYFTTYTYFTTIFVDGETEVSSRTEVYTNFVTPTITPTSAGAIIQPTILSRFNNDQVEAPEVQSGVEDTQDDEVTTKKRLMKLKVTPLNTYNSTISRRRPTANVVGYTERNTDIYDNVTDKLDNNIIKPSYSTMSRNSITQEVPSLNIDNNIIPDLNEYETIATMVTDVRSSSSGGERRIIDNVDKRNALDDQIVSESNNDSEISPSPTLLLQTSYTTFTYFTTMYQGTTSSNVVSRLETITNVVTETLTPTHTLSAEDLSLPITYFTTFTYWTTLYKDGSTTVTSREETVSNVVTPTATETEIVATEVLPTISITPTVTTVEPSIEATQIVEPVEKVEPTEKSQDDEMTTYYTTYTYYTTSYIGNSTVLNSRLETVTNVINATETVVDARAVGSATQNLLGDDEKTVTKTVEPDSAEIQPTGLLSTVTSSVINDGTTTLFSTDVYGTFIDGLYAKVLESTSSILTDSISPSSVAEVHLKPTGVVSINHGKIVDAEGVSTLFYTTQAIGTYIDNLYAQVIESTSSLRVDEAKKSALPADLEPITHKTGLVRLIEGSIVQNKTTTLYQSKVLGTVIDGRYAQIIESTSSFIVDKASKVTPSSISPTATSLPGQVIKPTDSPITPSPVIIEGSLVDSSKVEEGNETENEEEDEDDEDGSDRKKSRLTFSTRKRTFTPVIRPFASRGRPTFAPKRKGGSASSATTITRSDFTPTITATPALKSESTRGRFSSNRRQSSQAIAQPSASGSRRFSRPRGSATASAAGFSSSTFSPSGRGRSSSRIQPTATGFGRSSSARGGFRSSGVAANPIRSSSAFGGNPRFRIRPTLSSLNPRNPNSNAVTPPSTQSDDENDLTTVITDNPTDITIEDPDTTLPVTTTTEASRRNQNPLLRFRRPPLSRPAVSATSAPRQTTTRSPPVRNNVRNNGSTRNGNRATTTTPAPSRRTTRPSVALAGRSRPGNSLFPRRELFKPRTPVQKEPEPEEEPFEDEQNQHLEDDEDDDTEYEGSNRNSQTEKAPASTEPPAKTYGGVQIKPFSGLRRRSKRETNYSRFRNRGGRTTSTTQTALEYDDYEITEAAVKVSRLPKPNRFTPRARATSTSQPPPPPPQFYSNKKIAPTRATNNQARSQFTLREKDTSSNVRPNFRRPQQTSQRRSSTTTSSRPKSPRLRTTEQPASTYRSSSSRSRNTSTRRGSTSRGRARTSAESNDNYIIPSFDGTITVTHQIPTEATIPVVNGRVTEYKNIITAKISTAVLGPKQYTTSLAKNGKDVTVLLSESTAIAPNGATEITQFILNETPTTSIVFTPTYIRGRKTSFSHVIPSTAYGVETVVSTIQPALAAQAPLANILLSQLLLGNLGVQQQNPLLAFQMNPTAALTPTTEFKTRTTTYVTTVTNQMSTVVPLTFRGKEILTTIIDSSVNVVTATEFITDTIVVTPTQAYPSGGNQINSLLLPLLQQQLSNPLLQQQPLPAAEQPPIPQALLSPEILDRKLLNVADVIDQDDDISSAEEYDVSEEEKPVEEEKPRKLKPRLGKKPKIQRPAEPAAPPKQTSIITLYISGRRPGEFSTVLSTVIEGEDRFKRDATYVMIEPSKIVNEHVYTTTNEYFDNYVMPAMNEITVESPDNLETESLESIIGDVSKYIATHTSEFDGKATKPSTMKMSRNVRVKYAKISNSGSPKQSSGNFLA